MLRFGVVHRGALSTGLDRISKKVADGDLLSGQKRRHSQISELRRAAVDLQAEVDCPAHDGLTRGLTRSRLAPKDFIDRSVRE